MEKSSIGFCNHSLIFIRKVMNFWRQTQAHKKGGLVAAFFMGGVGVRRCSTGETLVLPKN
jgi:hypothetical protein